MPKQKCLLALKMVKKYETKPFLEMCTSFCTDHRRHLIVRCSYPKSYVLNIFCFSEKAMFL